MKPKEQRFFRGKGNQENRQKKLAKKLQEKERQLKEKYRG